MGRWRNGEGRREDGMRQGGVVGGGMENEGMGKEREVSKRVGRGMEEKEKVWGGKEGDVYCGVI